VRSIWVLTVTALIACGSSSPPPPLAPVLSNPAPPPRPPQKLDLDSADILARTDVNSPVMVKHVLIGWAELAENYHEHMDPRAAKRTHAEAAKLAQDIAAKLRAAPGSIDALIETHSEDPGSLSKEPYVIATDDPFMPEFKNLAQRLHLEEVGLVTTIFGYHVMIRVPPPPIDPLESAEILARPATPGPVEVQHVLLGWKDLVAAKDPRAQARTKSDADTLAVELLGKVRGGADIVALMKQFSEDPGSSNDGKPYSVDTTTPMVEPFKNLALRLKVGEAGLVKTVFGWHIVKRAPPPGLDKLESAAILARTATAERVKVKHILLGWKDAHHDDPRGAARTRPELEKLVKATLAKLAKKGAKIEPVMAELSEDPGSAKSGQSYDVTPDAGLVKPFLALSLRLKLNEVGVVKTVFGVHIIKRVE
jgi:parvulin-like peptidyl-prolyl isomerase